MSNTRDTVQHTIAKLERIGQSVLASHLRSLDEQSAHTLCEQLAGFDLDELATLVDRYGASYSPPGASAAIEPATCFSIGGDWDADGYRAKGEDLVRAGKVACFVVAGGQGSRLGYEGPKGCYPTSCVTNKPLFQLFAESIRASEAKFGAAIPWMIMTSPLNHGATRAFFEDHDHFGLDPKNVLFFNQGVMPSFDKDSGDLLLSDPTTLATNPDGHGGAYKAMSDSGALDTIQGMGVEHVSYFQVDNPHAKIIDPTFLGLHAFAPESSGQMSSKMVAKASWDEKVGVFCKVDGRTSVVEYSDLPESLAKQTNPDGSLAFNAGSIAIHAISVGFIRNVLADPESALPYHRAVKKVPHYDPGAGKLNDPSEPNAIKLERFVFDALGVADRSIVMETDRVEEFAPVKNATGTDSIESSRRIQSERAARWLESVGVAVPRDPAGNVDATIEISPLTALGPDDLRGKDLPSSIEHGSSVVL
jgi:UDP-N-acetylglucosamine/UDP-N-acetylgalactosamine diphosphorylase